MFFLRVMISGGFSNTIGNSGREEGRVSGMRNVASSTTNFPLASAFVLSPLIFTSPLKFPVIVSKVTASN